MKQRDINRQTMRKERKKQNKADRNKARKESK